MKYIRTEAGFFIFPKVIKHDQMLSGINRASIGSLFDALPISAGFVDIGPDGAFCHGESISLRIKSLPEDTELLNKEISL